MREDLNDHRFGREGVCVGRRSKGRRYKLIRRIPRVLGQVRKEAQRAVGILIAGEKDANREGLLDNLTSSTQDRQVFRLLELNKEMSVEEMVEEIQAVDLALILLDATQYFDEETVAFTVCVRELGKPFLVVLDGIEKIIDLDSVIERIENFLNVHRSKIVPISTSERVGLRGLMFKILEEAEGKEVALASRVETFRDVATEVVVRKTSLQNALIGGVTILPGSDMPILMANQMRMVLRVAAIYGEELTLERAKELLTVFCGGLTFRAVARQLLDFLPGPGWIIKGGVAYAGTFAVGKATRKYFEKGLGRLTFGDWKQVLSGGGE
ncbi:MAG TPA: hypothetical protein DCW86_03560 [Actinobacteria bacterium]|nr:hypothetical protein [Actinomycetota bacterium]